VVLKVVNPEEAEIVYDGRENGQRKIRLSKLRSLGA
jgi:hypothetical protein